MRKTCSGLTAGSGHASLPKASSASPSAAARGIPWTFPLGEVSGVFRSPWASNQSTPPAPWVAARPPSVPSAIEWSPPRTIGTEPSLATAATTTGDALAGVLDLGEEACTRVSGRGRLRRPRSRRCPSPTHSSPSARQAVVQARVADRGGPHVHAATACAEVERAADDCELSFVHGEEANQPVPRSVPLTARARACQGTRRRPILCPPRGEVAQLVEHTAENRGVAGSIPALATRPCRHQNAKNDVRAGATVPRTSLGQDPRRARPGRQGRRRRCPLRAPGRLRSRPRRGGRGACRAGPRSASRPRARTRRWRGRPAP